MRTTRVLGASVSAILLTFFLLPAAAHAQPCSAVVGVTPYPSIGLALGAIGQTGPGTIFVTGTCTENVSINGARSITITAFNPGGASVPGGATVVGPQDSDVFDISRSENIVLENLEISGVPGFFPGSGGGGVFVTQGSEARIIACDIHSNESVGVDADTGSVVVIRGTRIHDNTPNDGLDVYDNSTADVFAATIENNGDSANGGIGVFLSRNSVVLFHRDFIFGSTTLIQKNANVGIQARNLSNVVIGAGAMTIQNHLTNGIILQEGSHLQVNSPRTVIQDNGSACPLDPTCGGIFATQDSTVDLTGTISSNQGSGVSVEQGANVQLRGVTVLNNTGDGVHLQWISIGNFISGSNNTITGNGGKSVFCDTTSLAVGDLSGFSNIGCSQIARSIGPPRPGAVTRPNQ